MNYLYTQQFDIKTDEFIDNEEEQKRALSKIIKLKWDDEVNLSNFTIDELTAWAEYGSPRAFYTQAYSYEPVFIEQDDQLALPEKINVVHKKFSDIATMKKLGISLRTQFIYRSQEFDAITPNERHIKRIMKTLFNNLPSLRTVLTQEVQQKLVDVLQKIQFKSIAKVIIQVVYRLAHSNGIYVELANLYKILGVERESCADVKEFIDTMNVDQPSLLQVNNNLVEAIKSQVTNLLSLNLINMAQAQYLMKKLDNLDPLCLAVNKENRVEINLLVLIKYFLKLTFTDEKYVTILDQLVNEEDKRLVTRNVRYASHNFQPIFQDNLSSITHHDYYTILKHEFGLDIQFNKFTTFTDELMNLGCSEELSAVLITKTLLPEQGIRTLMTILTNDPLGLLTEYREFQLMDHPIFEKILLSRSEKPMNKEYETIDFAEYFKDRNQIPLPVSYPSDSHLSTHLGLDFDKLDQIIVISNPASKPFSLAFLDIALYLLRSGAWSKQDQEPIFLEQIRDNYPTLYLSFTQALKIEKYGKCESWGVNLTENTMSFSGKQLVFITDELDISEELITPHTIIINETQTINKLAAELFSQPVSRIGVFNTAIWFSWHIDSNISSRPIEVASESIKILGHPGEVRRTLLKKNLDSAILWLENEAEFDKEISCVLMKQNRIIQDLSSLKDKIKFIDTISMEDIWEFAQQRIPIPKGYQIVIPDIRRKLYRTSNLLSNKFDINNYIQRLREDLLTTHKQMQCDMQRDLQNADQIYAHRIQEGLVLPDIADENLMEFKKLIRENYYEQFRRTKEMVEYRIAQIQKDRNSPVTKDLLDRYNATYDEALLKLEQILLSNLNIGCTLSDAKISYRTYPPFKSKNSLDKKLIEKFNCFIHTRIPVSRGIEFPEMLMVDRTNTLKLSSKV